MKSTTEIQVRGYHIDAFGIVNHTRYLELMEEGRWRYMEDNNLADGALHSLGIIHVVVNINISYKSPAVLGDLLQIETFVARHTTRSFTMGQRIFNHETGALVAEADVTNVFLDGSTHEVCSIDEKMQNAWPDLASTDCPGS